MGDKGACKWSFDDFFDFIRRCVLVHPRGDVSTLLGGPDVQFLLVGAELSNGFVQSGVLLI